jgi:hypothetical protein
VALLTARGCICSKKKTNALTITKFSSNRMAFLIFSLVFFSLFKRPSSTA